MCYGNVLICNQYRRTIFMNKFIYRACPVILVSFKSTMTYYKFLQFFCFSMPENYLSCFSYFPLLFGTGHRIRTGTEWILSPLPLPDWVTPALCYLFVRQGLNLQLGFTGFMDSFHHAAIIHQYCLPITALTKFGTLGQIRTDTVRLLKPLTPADWSTSALFFPIF